MCAHHILQRPGLKVCKPLEKNRENSKLTWILFKKIQIQGAFTKLIKSKIRHFFSWIPSKSLNSLPIRGTNFKNSPLDILEKQTTDLRFYHLYADAELCARTRDPCQWIYSPHIIIIFQSCCLATTTEAAESVCTFINIYLISTTKIRVFIFSKVF